MDNITNKCIDFINCTNSNFLNKTTNKCDSKPVCKDQFYNSTTNICENFTNCTNLTFLNKTTNKCD